jgi:hypothetical protein
MQGRWETTHQAPRFFSHLPRTPSTHFPFPSPSKAENRVPAELRVSSGSFCWGHRGYRTPFAALLCKFRSEMASDKFASTREPICPDNFDMDRNRDGVRDRVSPQDDLLVRVDLLGFISRDICLRAVFDSI